GHVVRAEADARAALARDLPAERFERGDESEQSKFRGMQLMRQLVNADRELVQHPFGIGDAGAQSGRRDTRVARERFELDGKQRGSLPEVVMQLAADAAALRLLRRDELRCDVARA